MGKRRRRTRARSEDLGRGEGVRRPSCLEGARFSPEVRSFTTKEGRIVRERKARTRLVKCYQPHVRRLRLHLCLTDRRHNPTGMQDSNNKSEQTIDCHASRGLHRILTGTLDCYSVRALKKSRLEGSRKNLWVGCARFFSHIRNRKSAARTKNLGNVIPDARFPVVPLGGSSLMDRYKFSSPPTLSADSVYRYKRIPKVSYQYTNQGQAKHYGRSSFMS